MTSVRDNQIIVNLDQAAQDIIDFILNDGACTLEAQAKHKALLSDIIKEVSATYQASSLHTPILAQLESLIHLYSRRRTQALNAADKKIKSVDPHDSLAALEIMVDLMQSGNCEATSANAMLIDKLLLQLPKYQTLNDDVRINKLDKNAEASRIGIRKIFLDIFVEKAQTTICQYKAIKEKLNEVLYSEKPKPGKLDMSKFADMDIQVARYACKPEIIRDYQGGHNIKTAHAPMIAKLDKLFGKRLEEELAFAKEAARLRRIDVSETTASFKSARASISLFMQKRVAEERKAVPAPSLRSGL